MLRPLRKYIQDEDVNTVFFSTIFLGAGSGALRGVIGKTGVYRFVSARFRFCVDCMG